MKTDRCYIDTEFAADAITIILTDASEIDFESTITIYGIAHHVFNV